MKENFTEEEIKLAYRKLKGHVYYDKTNLFCRKRIAEFETTGNIEKKFKDICDALNEELEDKSDAVSSWINSGSYVCLPKSFEESKEDKADASVFYSNDTESIRNLEKISILYDGCVEMNIVNVLWLMNVGVLLTNGDDNLKPIAKCSYASQLMIKDGKLQEGLSLFKPYFTQYQAWRDNGIKVASHLLEDGNRALLVSLDIKSFFHNLHFDIGTLPNNGSKKNQCLNKILARQAEQHYKKVTNKVDTPFLPIGPLSSQVIANWVMRDFDDGMQKALSSVYYGRYVDDIFIVMANVDFVGDSPLHYIIDKYFGDNGLLQFENKEEYNSDIKIVGDRYNGLVLQQNKTRLFDLKPDSPQALLHNFQKALNENASAFVMLPTVNDEVGMEDQVFDLKFEDSSNKLRNIVGCKLSKFEMTAYLAKKLNQAMLWPGQEKGDIIEDLFKFMKGTNVLDLYLIWERVLTYLVLYGKTTDVNKFIKVVEDCISKVKESQTYKDEESNCGKGIGEVRESLSTYMNIAISMAVSYKMERIKDIKCEEDTKNIALSFRKSMLIRHNYLPLPILACTKLFVDGNICCDSSTITDLFKQKKKNDSPQLVKADFIPRYISLHEICIIEMIIRINSYNGTKENLFKNFVDHCIKRYYTINGHRNNFDEMSYKPPRKSNEKSVIYDEIMIESDDSTDLMYGLSNIKLSETEIVNDIKGKVIKSKVKAQEVFKRHSELINMSQTLNLDVLLLPEVSVPFLWLNTYASVSSKFQRAFLFGLQHITNAKGYCFNIAICMLPFVVNGFKHTIIVPRVKNHYAPSEEILIKSLGKKIPTIKPAYYDLIKWNGIRFSLFNCYELADIVHRSIFRSKVDILFAIEENRDTKYYSNIAESVTRDVHCYFVQANTSQYGDSRVVEPRHEVSMNPVRVKGGENDVILAFKLDIKGLRDFQALDIVGQTTFGKDKFKVTPPDFKHEEAREM